MKRTALLAVVVLLGFVGLLCVATFAWTTWVMSTGDGWLLAFMFNANTGTVPLFELWFVSTIIACLSFWAAAKVLRKSRSLVQPT